MTDFQKYLDQALKTVKIPVEEEPELPEYDVFSEIGYQIVTARNQIGITQKELAERADITLATISRIESNRSHPTIESLRRIADGLGLRLVVSFEDFDEDF